MAHQTTHQIHQEHNRQTPHSDWYVEKPTIYNPTTPETYINDPYFDGDSYHKPTIYDNEQLVFKQTIIVPFHEFAK